MALVLNVNSWVTVSQANTYFADKWGASAWAILTNAQKEQLLISAYRWIKSLSALTISTVTDLLKQAQYETAWYLYKYDAEHNKRSALHNQGVTSFTVLEFSEDLKGAKFPDYIMEYLKAYITGGTAQIVTVTRELD
jgi:hypothetical protein